jgi:hypothetical protein
MRPSLLSTLATIMGPFVSAPDADAADEDDSASY